MSTTPTSTLQATDTDTDAVEDAETLARLDAEWKRDRRNDRILDVVLAVASLLRFVGILGLGCLAGELLAPILTDLAPRPVSDDFSLHVIGFTTVMFVSSAWAISRLKR